MCKQVSYVNDVSQIWYKSSTAKGMNSWMNALQNRTSDLKLYIVQVILRRWLKLMWWSIQFRVPERGKDEENRNIELGQ